MEEINLILDQIEKETYRLEKTKEKHEILSDLWTKYYQLCKKYKLQSERGYQLYLLGENESLIIDAKNKIPKIDSDNLNLVLNKMNQSMLEFQNPIPPLTKEEAMILLDWTVSNTRKTFRNFGINVENSSLNGLCELGQALSILPFEKRGFPVTKNLAQLTFGYLWNHAFGTVTIPIIEQDKVIENTYLIDTTYLQFFTTTRCNEGRYDAKEENTDLETAPDPGYFLTTSKEQQFAKELIENGYIELTEENAEIYRKGFQQASILKNEKIDFPKQESAKQTILKTNTTYILNERELEEIDQEASFPTISTTRFYS